MAESVDAKQLLLAKPTAAQAYAELGYTLHQHVHYQAAIRCYKAGLSIDPDCDRLHCLLGLTYHNLGNHPLAIKHYARAAELNSANAEAHYYLGFILIQEGRTCEAIQHLQQSLTLKADLNPAYFYLGIALERQGRHNEALDLLVQRLKDTTSEPAPDVVFTMGELLSRRRRYTTRTCHTQAIVDSLLYTLTKQEIHVFGDSHRSVFSHLEDVRCHNVGAGTAYNLVVTTSSTGAGNKILAITRELDSQSACILLVFGEIDCMEHLFKNHYRTGTHPDSLLDILVKRYISFASQLTESGFTVLIYGPAFSGLALNSHGSLHERNWMVKRFNQKLSAACKENDKILFASLDWLLVRADLTPILELSEDGRHLDAFPQGSKVLQAVVLGKFLEAAQAKHRDDLATGSLDLNTGNLALGKPYILINGQHAHSESAALDMGIISTRGRYRLSVEPGAMNSLILDLLDHMKIDSLRVRLAAQDGHSTLSGELQVFGLQQHGLHWIGKRTFTNIKTADVGVTLSRTVARGLVLRVQAIGEHQPDQATSLVLEKLCVRSCPEHETLI
jgi:Tfp pilus assembly protein PilF